MSKRIINLLPFAAQKEISLELAAGLLTRFYLWLIGSLVLLFILGIAVSAYLKTEINAADEEITINQVLLGSSNNEQVKTEVGKLNQDIKQIENITNQHYYWSQGLVELSRLLTSDMHIDLLSFDRASGIVSIAGRAAKRDSVLKFWSNMHKTGYFQDIDFPLTNLEQAVNTPFTFTFSINPKQFQKE